jgi:hypothetical protein
MAKQSIWNPRISSLNASVGGADLERRERGQAIVMTIREAVLDREIGAFDKAAFLKTPMESCQPLRKRAERLADQKHRNSPSVVDRSGDSAVTPGAALAAEFARSHGKRVEEVMSENVITATEDNSLADIEALFSSVTVSSAFRSCVSDGKVHLWGLVGSPAERTALIALAEDVPWVTEVLAPPSAGRTGGGTEDDA